MIHKIYKKNWLIELQLRNIMQLMKAIRDAFWAIAFVLVIYGLILLWMVWRDTNAI